MSIKINDLNNLIKLIQIQYDYINNKWQNSNIYYPLNMKRNRVEDVYKDELLLFHIFNYRNFINDNISEVVNIIQKQKYNNIVNTRVKAINSIQYKIQNYLLKHENGKIALKKCLNDIFGIRIILEEDINYDEIKDYIEKHFSNLKCIDSKKGNYKAIHVYFGNEDNFSFQWELQIWKKEDEKNNLESHAKYKQDYTKWEQIII